MCSSCDPGSARLASWLLHDLELRGLLPSPDTSASTPEDADTKLFCNGIILTLANGTFSPVDALVVKGDVIAYAWNLQGANEVAGPGAETRDLKGRYLLPGFIEPHLHLILTALADQYLLKLSPLDNEYTLSAVMKSIKDQANNPKLLLGGVWIAGYGYDPSRIQSRDPGQDHPDLTRAMLDGISTEAAIYVLNQSGHIAYVNSKALAIANITVENVKNDNNFQKDAKTGELTGLLS